jgi:hypothetical protein
MSLPARLGDEYASQNVVQRESEAFSKEETGAEG